MHGFPVSDHVPYVRRYYELTILQMSTYSQNCITILYTMYRDRIWDIVNASTYTEC